MDRRYRLLERACLEGDPDACLQAYIWLKRKGNTNPATMPSSVLYAGTEWVLETQPFLDFRNLLEKDIGRRLYRAIRFNNDYSMSIQMSRTHYCSPREDLDSPFDYSSMEISFSTQPTIMHSLYLDAGDETNPILIEYREEQLQRLEEWKEDPNATIEWDGDDSARVTVVDPEFEEGGLLWGFPHMDAFSPYDSGIGPYVNVTKIQDMIDFMRARFGLRDTP